MGSILLIGGVVHYQGNARNMKVMMSDDFVSGVWDNNIAEKDGISLQSPSMGKLSTTCSMC